MEDDTFNRLINFFKKKYFYSYLLFRIFFVDHWLDCGRKLQTPLWRERFWCSSSGATDG